MERRDFLKLSLLSGTGLLFSFSLTSQAGELLDTNVIPSIHELDALIHISRDNQTTIILNRVEMGQGVLTGLPMLVAEELELDWSLVKVQQAEVNEHIYGDQTTTASISIHSGWSFAREAGAKVKEMLLKAAANRWHVNKSQCFAKNSFVYGPKGKKASFGELAESASTLPVPISVTLKSEKDFTLIGKSVKRVQLKEMVSGKARYGIDVDMEGLNTATIIKPPVRDAKLVNWTTSYNDKNVQIVEVISGLAVVGKNFWSVQKAAAQIRVNWDIQGFPEVSSQSLNQHYQNNLTDNVPDANSKTTLTGKKRISSAFQIPHMAHATMEPVNATAKISAQGCEIYAPTQAPDKVQKDISELLGLAKDKVVVHVTLLGGGFGRKSYRDFIVDAVLIAKKIARPVKLIYTRENDIKYDMLRPATYHKTSAIVSREGNLDKVTIQAAGPSILQFYQYPKLDKVPEIDFLTFAGTDNFPYQTKQLKTKIYTDPNPRGPAVGILRSIGHSASCYVRECFVDQLAQLQQQDPLNYRLRLLQENERAQNVLRQAAQLANWGQTLPDGHFQGCALFEEAYPEDNYYTCNVQIAEISLQNNELKVHRVVTVGDFGRIIHPDLVAAQMEGGVIFGMSLTLFDRITVENGQVQQSNFHDYRLPRMTDAPKVDTHIIESTEKPSGVGEKVVPATIPAICNAYYAATGQLTTSLPLTHSG